MVKKIIRDQKENLLVRDKKHGIIWRTKIKYELSMTYYHVYLSTADWSSIKIQELLIY